MERGDGQAVLSTVLHEYKWILGGIDTEGRRLHINAMALSQDERYLAVGYDLTIKDDDDDDESYGKFRGSKNGMRKKSKSERKSSNRNNESSSATDTIIRIFEIYTGRIVCIKHLTCNTKVAKIITCLCWSFDMKYIYAGTLNGVVLCYDINSPSLNPVSHEIIQKDNGFMIVDLVCSPKDVDNLLITIKCNNNNNYKKKKKNAGLNKKNVTPSVDKNNRIANGAARKIIKKGSSSNNNSNNNNSNNNNNSSTPRISVWPTNMEGSNNNNNNEKINLEVENNDKKPKKKEIEVKMVFDNGGNNSSLSTNKIIVSEQRKIILFDLKSKTAKELIDEYQALSAIYINDYQDIAFFIRNGDDHFKSQPKFQHMLIYNLKKTTFNSVAITFPDELSVASQTRLNNLGFQFQWLQSENRIFVSCHIGFYFINPDKPNEKPVLFFSKKLGQYNHFHCGKIMHDTKSKTSYLIGLRDHYLDNGGGRDRNSLCIWDIWDANEMINVPITIPHDDAKRRTLREYYPEIYVQNAFSNAIFFRSVHGNIRCFRRVENLNLDWGGAMFPARFKIIDVNKGHVESESEFDKVDNLKQKEYEMEKFESSNNDDEEINILLNNTHGNDDYHENKVYLFTKPLTKRNNKHTAMTTGTAITTRMASTNNTQSSHKICKNDINAMNSTSNEYHFDVLNIPGFGNQYAIPSSKPTMYVKKRSANGNVRKKKHGRKEKTETLKKYNTTSNSMMLKLHVDFMTRHAVERKQALASKRRVQVPVIKSHTSFIFHDAVKKLSEDDFKLFLLLARPVISYEELQKEFPNEPYQQLFKRADALGFKIRHIKKRNTEQQLVPFIRSVTLKDGK